MLFLGLGTLSCCGYLISRLCTLLLLSGWVLSVYCCLIRVALFLLQTTWINELQDFFYLLNETWIYCLSFLYSEKWQNGRYNETVLNWKSLTICFATWINLEWWFVFLKCKFKKFFCSSVVIKFAGHFLLAIDKSLNIENSAQLFGK